MNQILDTGDDKRKKESAYKARQLKSLETGQREKIGTKSIVSFFAICIILLGICIVSGTVYARGKINDMVEASIKPTVEMNRNDEDNTVEISVKHIRGIKTIAYWWNDEEETVIDAKNQKSITEKIPLINGKNTLTISVIEENGQSVTYQKEFTLGNIPEITLEAIDNGVKVTVNAEVPLQYITYQWDDEPEQRVDVVDQTYQGIISAPSGKHTLKIVAVDSNSISAEKTQVVFGSTPPSIDVKVGRRYSTGKLYFVVTVEDDEEITNIEITLNGGEKQTIEVNDKTYYSELELIEGENRIIITAENSNGSAITSKRYFDTNSLDEADIQEIEENI